MNDNNNDDDADDNDNDDNGDDDDGDDDDAADDADDDGKKTKQPSRHPCHETLLNTILWKCICRNWPTCGPWLKTLGCLVGAVY